MTNTIMAVITAYCCCTKCTKGTGITANGQTPKEGTTIAASRKIPFGSKVISSAIPKSISRTQTLVVQDRLAKRYDSRFDIYFESHEKARQFGIKKNQKVIVIIR